MPFRACPDGVRVRLKVTPKAKRAGIGGLLDEPDSAKALKVAVTAAPEDGKSNAALVALLAEEWAVAKSAISVVSGATDRRKLVEIRGPSQELLARLQRWLAGRKTE
ncbi:DUF167 domain-containing protein [Dongia deserti]|uniref:DUF167 domain-containing protein n=1 Tax=Dongia deserti TaxID=2268030 RepID=UPI000E659B49|nr:DUF167 domain-containing protein [Dongia deserti]